jgi:LacI family fructose operon transcriptional repressor
MAAPKTKPTIYDIARLCEASPSTVSAVLSGSWKTRRISARTAEKIAAVADETGYSANLQARGLRRARSGMVGMILPVHDNHFFAEMSQSFEAHARARGLCPVIVSTLRDPAEERRTVETLIAYAIDSLFIAGATDPAAVGDLCRNADVPHVYVDLPGHDAPSVVSDNFSGAEQLTRTILSHLPASDDPVRGRPYFLGGDPGDHATSRLRARFRQERAQAGPT